MEHFHPSIHNALDWITNRIDNGEWKSGQALPKLRSLAAQAHVATITMSRALHILERQGKITIQKKKGIFVGNAPESPLLPKILPKWQIMRRRFEEDLLNGFYQKGKPIPVFSVLKHRYGISDYTLRRLINDLKT